MTDRDKSLATAFGVPELPYAADPVAAFGLLRKAAGSGLPGAETVFENVGGLVHHDGAIGAYLELLVGAPSFGAEVVDGFLLVARTLSPDELDRWRKHLAPAARPLDQLV